MRRGSGVGPAKGNVVHRIFAAAALLLPLVAVTAEVDSITVTAHLTPLPIDASGSSLTVITREDLQRQQTAVAADALRSVPGIAVGRAGPFGAQTQVRLRGAEANHVLVVIDGIEVNDVAADDAYAFEHLTTFGIERIEVVRGPQSALWGSDALTGVINVESRLPSEPFEAGAFAESGWFGFLNAGGRVGFAGDTGTLAASLSHYEADGENAAEIGSENDGYDNDTATLLATLRLAESLTLDAHWRHSDIANDYDALDFADGVMVAVDADNSKDVRQDFGRAGGRLALLDGRWRQSLHYGIAVTETRSVAEESFEDGNTQDGGLDRAEIRGNRYGIYYQSSLDLGEAREGALPDSVAFAIDHERETFRQRAEAGFFGDPNQYQSLTSTGFVAEYVTTLFDRLTLSAGARHDDNSDFGDVNTWRGTASWRLPDGATRLHGSYGTGQKSPTFFERYGYTPDQFIGNTDLEPETSRGWDAGVEWKSAGERLRADLTYFKADLNGEINGFWCAPPDFICTAVNEAGKSHRKGVEALLETALGDRFDLVASYTYTDARGNDASGGAREVRRPMHSGSLDLTGQWFDSRLVVGLAARYTGGREDDAFLLDPPYVERVALDAYTLVNLTASWEFSPESVIYGRIENLLDEDYQDVYGFNTPGIGGFVGLRTEFGGARP
ncbi:MAG: TonB-dependent receptor [Gammaproteobacteria bacterium]|nr:TonB-dependent receptor [Gammaproteobacteria bacterium]